MEHVAPPGSRPGPHVSPKLRGSGPLGLVAILLLAFFFGLFPVYEYVDAHRVPGDATLQQATVVGNDLGSRGSDQGYLVNFRLPDGSTHQIYFESRFVRPQRGDTLEVYREGDDWRSPAERSTLGLLGGIGALLLFGALAFGWFSVRRRARRVP